MSGNKVRSNKVFFLLIFRAILYRGNICHSYVVYFVYIRASMLRG